MVSCPQCGMQNADEAKFCDRCGQGLARAAAAPPPMALAPLAAGAELKGGWRILEVIGQTACENRYRAERPRDDGGAERAQLRERALPPAADDAPPNDPTDAALAPSDTAENPSGPNAKTDTVIWRACHLAQRMGEPPATCHHIRILVMQHLGTPPTLFPAGIANDAARTLLHQPGETLTSSLDIRLQQTAHRMVYQMTHHNTASLSTQSSAVIILDNTSGKILAYASQYPNAIPSPFEQPIAVTALAQPLLYAFALNTDASTADTIENDAPLPFINTPLAPAPDYPIDFDTALANAQYPAAWRIWQQIDQTDWKNFLQSLNLQTSNTSTPAVTGNLINLANAWQMLANHGTRQTASFYPDDTHQSQPILPPDIADRIASALTQPRMTAGIWINPHAPTAWLAEQDACQTEIAGYTNQITLLLFRQSTTCAGNLLHSSLPAWQRLINN